MMHSLLAAQRTSIAEWASVATATGALLLTVVFGLSNRRTARRALVLSERQEARRESRVDVHLNESLAWRRPQMNDRLLGLHLIVTNPTDRATTIERAEVRVTYSVSGVVTTVNVPATSTADLDQPLPDVVVVELPVRLEANGGTSGWFLFRVPDGLVGGGGVDRYEVVLKDIHGIEETVQVTIFHEVSL